jgi:hypothetical protein
MATNPKLPDFPDIPPRKPTSEPAKLHLVRQSKFPWPIVALIVGAALLVTIISVLPKAPRVARTPSGAEVPRQPTGEQIQLTQVQIVPSPVGDSLYLNAILHNTGNSAITGIQVNAQFMGADGAVAGGTTAAVQGVSGGTSSEDLTQAPIKPNESRPVRIYFAHTPKGWNHQVPALTVSTVTGTTP